jgi:aspartyl-tRNA(Asn)/glutamyl-tRNA(Gln) amidotransferase subunit A
MTKPLNELSIVEATRGLRAKECSVRELWDACASAARERNSELNAYLELFEADDAAMAAAQACINSEIAGGEAAPPLCGIPLAIKDNILIQGHITSAASKMLENYTATYDATVITKLKEAGALFLGRANMDEFAMGSSTEHSAFGAAKNPIDPSRVPGGSSGGSAAAVAAHMAIAALGTDTGGSIRQPAAHTELVGLKPTYGAVSRYGAIALGSSLDQIGPIAKTVADTKLLHETLAGHDLMDATTNPENVFPMRAHTATMCIGVPRAFIEGVDADVREAFERTLAALEAAGHTLVDIELPTSTYALPVYYVIMPAEASTNLARYDGIRYGLAKRGATLLDDYIQSKTEGFGAETQRRILLGTFVLSSGYIDAYYRKAEAARNVLRAEYNRAFEQCDVIAFPTTPSPAFKFGEKSNDPVSMYLEDVFTVTANLTGMPALSVPMGKVKRDGTSLPIGMHFTAPHGDEAALFKIGAAVTGETLY